MDLLFICVESVNPNPLHIKVASKLRHAPDPSSLQERQLVYVETFVLHFLVTVTTIKYTPCISNRYTSLKLVVLLTFV